MSRFCCRALAGTATAGCLALLVLVPSACASRTPAPTPPQKVITIPSPDQISYTLDTSRCPRLKAYVAALAGGVGSFQSADRHPAAATVASGLAQLLALSLTAAECASAGN